MEYCNRISVTRAFQRRNDELEWKNGCEVIRVLGTHNHFRFFFSLQQVQPGHQDFQNRIEAALEGAKSEDMPSVCLICQLDSVYHKSSNTPESSQQSFPLLCGRTMHCVFW
jgi:hypothetical protein